MENSNHEVFNLLNQIREAQERSSAPLPAPSPPPVAPAPSKPPIDPAEISTYSAAVKYVARYISHDDQILARIRLLLDDQERHENEWFEDREAIIRRQKDRQLGQQKLDGILKLVSGTTTSPSITPLHSSLSDNIRELETHDLKVYKSALKLVENHEEQLRELRIPLFCHNSPSSSKEDKQKLLEFLKDIARE